MCVTPTDVHSIKGKLSTFFGTTSWLQRQNTLCVIGMSLYLSEAGSHIDKSAFADRSDHIYSSDPLLDPRICENACAQSDTTRLIADVPSSASKTAASPESLNIATLFPTFPPVTVYPARCEVVFSRLNGDGRKRGVFFNCATIGRSL